MTNVSAAKAALGGKVDTAPVPVVRGGPPHHREQQRAAMTATAATAPRVRTGGPQEDGPKILEHVAGWTLVVAVAMLVTQLGLL
ncbi:hypothetical protein GCM10009535_27620 [Streptomyces thermocarboxydovorans]|uniref:SCO1431 family membrane protein n=1 Tax=Streptomyces thermocarboxydovorans TaxID=59298 RepID=A0ABN1HH25_9ACTN